MQEPKIYSSPFCKAPWLTATAEASPNSRHWLAALAPPFEGDNKFTGAHISRLVAAHIATASPDVQTATLVRFPTVLLRLLERQGCSAGPREGTDPRRLWVEVCSALINMLSDRLFVLDWCSCVTDLLLASQWKFCQSHTFLLQQSRRKGSYWEETIIKKQVCLCEVS